MAGQMSAAQVLHNVYTESLAPFSSIISLAEYLAEKSYISTDTIDRVTLLEEEGPIGVNQSKEIIVDILVTLGPAKVADVKKALREFGKSNKKKTATSLEKLDIKLPPSLAPVENGVDKETRKDTEPRTRERESKRSRKAPKNEVRPKGEKREIKSFDINF